MDREEFAYWQALTGSSRSNWQRDMITSLNGKGELYYIGGEDGCYMHIDEDGSFSAGEYTGAVPHIGEALFRPLTQKHCDSRSDALIVAMEFGGKQFLTDILSNHAWEAERAARRASERVDPQTNDRESAEPDEENQHPDVHAPEQSSGVPKMAL